MVVDSPKRLTKLLNQKDADPDKLSDKLRKSLRKSIRKSMRLSNKRKSFLMVP